MMILILTIDDDAPVMYILNDKQNIALGEILHKIVGENFSVELQQTYLIELLHFLTKLYLYDIPIEMPSLN